MRVPDWVAVSGNLQLRRRAAHFIAASNSLYGNLEIATGESPALDLGDTHILGFREGFWHWGVDE